jgi:hypothetical protein
VLITAPGRVGESAFKSSRTVVEAPIAEIRAGHVEIDAILKLIDAESTFGLTASGVVLLLMKTVESRDTDQKINDVQSTVESTRDGMTGSSKYNF